MAGTGRLSVVATPIGNLDDISARALEALRSAECVLCEDTRHTAKLLHHYGVDTATESLHEHNEASKCRRLLERLVAGAHLAMVSDAGTPLLSDPGRRLVSEAHRAGVCVTPLPGASALTAALSAAGFEVSQFVFEGFPPSRAPSRLKRFQELAGECRTLVFFETPHRIADSIKAMAEAFGADRGACLAKELSKMHESVVSATLGGLSSWLAEDQARRRGEFVVVVQGAADAADDETATVDVKALLAALLTAQGENASPRRAAAAFVELTGRSRNRAYRDVLSLLPKPDDGSDGSDGDASD